MTNTPASVAVVQTWQDKIDELYQWTGSAFLAGEKINDQAETKAALYSWLCGLGGWLMEAKEHADRLAFQQPGVEALVDHVTKALYDAAPCKAISPALSEATGLPIGEVISYEIAIASGFDVTGLRRHAVAAIAALKPSPDAALRLALVKAHEAMTEYYRYFTGGETRGSYDGKPERSALWQAMYAARSALAAARSQKQGEGL